MGATRWEAERAAAVMARSRAGTSARRRAEILARRARQAGREGTGVAGTAVHQEVTPPLWRRAMAHDDGAEGAARLFFLAIGGAVVLWTFWPGIVLGAGLYGAFYMAAPRIGRTPWWPPAVGAVVILVIGWWTGFMARPWEMTVTPMPTWPIVTVGFPLPDVPGAVWISKGLWALVVGLAIFAFEVRAWGWDAAGAVAPPEKNRDGSWRVIEDKEKAKLDPLAGVETPAESEAVDLETVEARLQGDQKIRLAGASGEAQQVPDPAPHDDEQEQER